MLTVQLSLPSELGRKSNGTIPRMQPTATPTALPMFIAQRVDPLVICSGSKLGWGTPNLLAKVSIYQAEPIPATSEMAFPKAAAAMVDIPRAVPRVKSM